MKRLYAKITAAIAVAIFALNISAQHIVDVHSHNVMPGYMAALERHDATLDEGFPIPAWSAEEHLDFMSEAGIASAVLTMPAPQPYFGDVAECAEVTRKYNEDCALLKKQHGKFLFCASLPLPDVDAAIADAVYVLDTLGADGVKLATNSRGQYLGDEALKPLMAVLNERRAVVILHPHKPTPVNDGLMASLPLAAYEYPAETTRAVLNMLVHGTLEEYPDIKWVVPHCGSFLPLAIPRLKALLPALQSKGLVGKVDVDASLERLWFDLAGAATPDVLQSLLTITDHSHLLYGSDYPYQPAAALTAGIERLCGIIAADPTLAPHKDAILGGNARRLFGQKALIADEVGDTAREEQMLIRISEIEVYPEYLDEYLTFALNVGATSVKEEPGVIAIYPMTQQRDSCQIRILEIYASQDAYKHHITTDHFQTYKQGTLHMVKSLDLVDMHPMDPSAMPLIFKKMNQSPRHGLQYGH